MRRAAYELTHLDDDEGDDEEWSEGAMDEQFQPDRDSGCGDEVSGGGRAAAVASKGVSSKLLMNILWQDAAMPKREKERQLPSQRRRRARPNTRCRISIFQ